MPQLCLPLFPHGVTEINAVLAFSREEDTVTYYHGALPVFMHAVEDLASFRMISAQFYVCGHAKQAELARAFGVPLVTLKRAVRRYKEEGVRGFYAEPKRRGAAVLTPERLEEAQNLLDEGYAVAEVAQKLAIKRDTLRKAVCEGRLHAVKKRA
jgi:transposase-like protein